MFGEASARRGFDATHDGAFNAQPVSDFLLRVIRRRITPPEPQHDHLSLASSENPEIIRDRVVVSRWTGEPHIFRTWKTDRLTASSLLRGELARAATVEKFRFAQPMICEGTFAYRGPVVGCFHSISRL